MRGRKWGVIRRKRGRTGVGGGEQEPARGKSKGARDEENEISDQRTGKRGMMKEAGKKRRRQRGGRVEPAAVSADVEGVEHSMMMDVFYNCAVQYSGH